MEDPARVEIEQQEVIVADEAKRLKDESREKRFEKNQEPLVWFNYHATTESLQGISIKRLR